MVIRRFINIFKGQLHYHQFLACGFQLGGNIVPGNLRNTSIVYGRKNNNYIVKISSTSLQFKKSLKLMSRHIKRKSTLYFIHSHFGFKLLMNQLYNKTNMLYLTFTNFITLNCNTSKIHHFTFGQLKKLYFISKWKPGLLTNRIGFFQLRIFKKLPIRFPKFGFVNDYQVNLVCVKEFKYSRVPFSSIMNVNVVNSSFGFFDIPGNGLSYDTVFFNLNCTVASAIFGAIQEKSRKFVKGILSGYLTPFTSEKVIFRLFSVFGLV
jgi:ribosomal protein S2